MKRAVLFLVVFAMVGSLWAADPIIGTWKLNVEESKFSPILKDIQPPPKERTEVYREIEGDLIEFSSTTIAQDVADHEKTYFFEHSP